MCMLIIEMLSCFMVKLSMEELVSATMADHTSTIS